MMSAADSFPLRIRSAPKAAQLPVRAQVEQRAHQCRAANALTYVREFADGESMRQVRDRILHELPFCALRRSDRADANLEILVRGDQGAEKIFQPRPQVVLAVVPTLGASVQHLVIGFLAPLDDALQADVPANAVAGLVKEQRRKQGPQPAG